MQTNVGIQNQGVLAWDGTTSYPRDVRGFVAFGFVFEVTADLAADAVFNIEAAPPSDADPCVPGDFSPVPEISICDRPAEAGPQATVTIPSGTVAGTICAATIPCIPSGRPFIQLVSASGPTNNVQVVMVRSGPKM